MENDFEFLIRVDDRGYFLANVSGRTVTGSLIMSAAAHSNYLDADRICLRLRVHGYPQAIVTNQTGHPVTAEMLDASGSGSAPENDLAKSTVDVDKIPAAKLKRKMKVDPIFRERVYAIWGTTEA